MKTWDHRLFHDHIKQSIILYKPIQASSLQYRGIGSAMLISYGRNVTFLAYNRQYIASTMVHELQCSSPMTGM